MKFGKILAFATASMLFTATSFAATMGEFGGAASPTSAPNAYNTPILTYTNFTGGSCTQTGFSVNATGNDNANGTVNVNVTGTVNGATFTSGSFNLGPGPFTFATSFGQPTFTSPAPTSNTYTVVFNSNVFQGGQFLGTSVTTIQCTAGVLSATNVFNLAASLPTMSEWSLALMALLVALAGGVFLYRRRNTAA